MIKVIVGAVIVIDAFIAWCLCRVAAKADEIDLKIKEKKDEAP